MKMRSIPTVLASLLFLGASNLALAADERAQVATLDKSQGTVMVDQGKGFASFKAPAKLNEGDRVITLDSSGAEIVFNDGCRAELMANNMIVITLNPGCKASILAIASPKPAGTVVTALPILGIPILAAAGTYLLSSSGNDNTPISGE